ncbi:hypothetical protein DNU06_15310 [Putridiphycobacter roseus]|uniref:Thiamine biosynthesis protein ThiJ n=1 Tax=Putridiphycobacter roseus TaxID=2219161 RepID=A0A2W1MXC1_9FLAO|nr:type 1 glutamine amidotransferase domain-containing protein [Putridiphycobacter roseus]PZE16014.1 hypothetical protein DNU06_15310 [Putridiphycobacter roseus]
MKGRKKIVIPLPSYGFDPSEVAIPWQLLSKQNYTIVFATPDGKKAAGDSRMLNGKGLGLFKPVLKARKDAVQAYQAMEKSNEFCNPLKYDILIGKDFDAILLPGGHDKGVKEYLESKILQKLIVHFFLEEKPVAAICHGVVLAARSINPETKNSVIYNYKTTALLKSQELLAYRLTKLWLKDYYLTYPEKTVAEEVASVLSTSSNFLKGPKPIFRDDTNHLSRGFTVRDKNYLSARWPGDVYSFTFELMQMLENPSNKIQEN